MERRKPGRPRMTVGPREKGQRACDNERNMVRLAYHFLNVQAKSLDDLSAIMQHEVRSFGGALGVLAAFIKPMGEHFLRYKETSIVVYVTACVRPQDTHELCLPVEFAKLFARIFCTDLAHRYRYQKS